MVRTCFFSGVESRKPADGRQCRDGLGEVLPILVPLCARVVGSCQRNCSRRNFKRHGGGVNQRGALFSGGASRLWPHVRRFDRGARARKPSPARAPTAACPRVQRGGPGQISPAVQRAAAPARAAQMWFPLG